MRGPRRRGLARGLVRGWGEDPVQVEEMEEMQIQEMEEMEIQEMEEMENLPVSLQ